MAFNELALAAIDDEFQLEGVRDKGRATTARGGFLCMLHRNEPGWFVGEHMHVRDDWDFIVVKTHFVEAIEQKKWSMNRNMNDMILFMRAKKANGGLQFERICGLVFLVGEFLAIL